MVRLAIYDAEFQLANTDRERAEDAQKWLHDLRVISLELEKAADKWVRGPSLALARFEKKLDRLRSGKLTKAERQRARKFMREQAAT